MLSPDPPGSADFNPRSPRGERRKGDRVLCGWLGISTHAPLAGSDGMRCMPSLSCPYFNPRSPRGERQSGRERRFPPRPYFNPRSPRGERLPCLWVEEQIEVFQPTLPSRGATSSSGGTTKCSFQPTLPSRGATGGPAGGGQGDAGFQPTLPSRGATLLQTVETLSGDEFQPTLPSRGATVVRHDRRADQPISTHAPLAGSDPGASWESTPARFQPTLPSRGATLGDP